MSEIIKYSERVTATRHYHNFTWRDNPNAGFSFPCDERGVIDTGSLNKQALENLEACQSGSFNVSDNGVQTSSWTYTDYAIMRCDCGAEVVLYGFTNSCDKCGADYNWAGQRLAPRSQWGEDTGESLSDILRIP